MKFYVYCLAEKLASPAVAMTGISGASVEVVEIEGFSILVSRFEGEKSLVTRENVLTHDNVVRSVLNETTPLPIRFGSVVSEKQLAGYLRTHRANLENRLAQVRGCLEMSVKIIWETDQTDFSATSGDSGPGAAFLQQKHREIVGSERRTKDAREVAAWLEEQVGSFVRQEEISLCPTEKLIIAVAHLVAREQVTKYRDRLALARNLRPELHFLVSGPWPPYTFSNIELEFKTRFGVS